MNRLSSSDGSQGHDSSNIWLPRSLNGTYSQTGGSRFSVLISLTAGISFTALVITIV